MCLMYVQYGDATARPKRRRDDAVERPVDASHRSTRARGGGARDSPPRARASTHARAGDVASGRVREVGGRDR